MTSAVNAWDRNRLNKNGEGPTVEDYPPLSGSSKSQLMREQECRRSSNKTQGNMDEVFALNHEMQELNSL